MFDVVIQNGRYFDGLGSPSAIRHVGIRAGRVERISETVLPVAGAKVIDASGQWVLPGFLDVHTHYDAEVLVAPGLGESVRHGVTSVFLGSCSLSTVHVDPLDGADLFSRVEAVPREHVLAALERHKAWKSAAEYASFLERLPLGPNVACYLGHSDVRTHVMGLGRAVDAAVEPSSHELGRMEALLEDALDAGFVGLSTMTNPFDKLDGDRHRSKARAPERAQPHLARERPRLLSIEQRALPRAAQDELAHRRRRQGDARARGDRRMGHASLQ
jgi:N-acyl-D-aspartate/D-glutamate deacylase